VQLGELGKSLSSTRCRLKSRTAVENAAQAILQQTGAERWIRVGVTDTVSHEHRQITRGRPGKDTSYRRIDHHRFSLATEVDAAAVTFDAASDGCFPFVTNEDSPPGELLRVYKIQPRLERRHATFKGVIDAAPVLLKSDTRIDALGFCLYVALLVHALVEREIRKAMVTEGITSLAMYHEGRACTFPTAARIFELLEPLSAKVVLNAGKPLAVIAPKLDPLQRQILTLLDVPMGAYDVPQLSS
jgi:transposase